MLKHRIIAVLLCFTTLSIGASEKTPVQPPEPDPTHPKTLDGTYIFAVETYLNKKQHALNLGAGFYPLNAYYNGFSGEIGYTYHFNNTFAWEVIRANASLNVQKDLTSQLASQFGVNPERIEKMENIFSTQLLYYFSYGKHVAFSTVLQYSRTALLGGMSLVKTSLKSRFAANLGLSVEGYIDPTFSWRIEVRDAITVDDFSHFVGILVGSSVYF